MTGSVEIQRVDFVEYFLFLISDNDIDSDRKLQEIYDQIFYIINPLITDYIWHKDKFNLSKNRNGNTEDLNFPYLHGVVHYGENLDDEYFIVYLLKKISEEISDVCIRVTDSDGEFLLIEAANYLPKWIKPETSINRVYIYNGIVRILISSENINKKTISSNELITILRETNISPLEQTVTQCINDKIQKFSNLNDILHKSRAYIPAKIAALLDFEPNLIASAVTSFCQRDIIDMKRCRKFEYFPPEDMIVKLVTFTKFLYAMICHQKINPVRGMNWVLPQPSNPAYKEHLLGFKIMCGFEILLSKYDGKSSKDLSVNKKWNQYIEVLKRKGYFKDLYEGSKEYVELKKKAQAYFLDKIGSIEPQNNILNILQTLHHNVDSLKQEESQLCSDDEKWMEINEEEFNELLQKQFGLQSTDVSNSPQILSSTIKNFLNHVSDIDGVEYKNNEEISSFNINETNANQNSISFSSEEFLSSIQKMLDISDMCCENTSENDDSEVDIDDSEEYEDADNETNDDLIMQSYMNIMDEELKKSSLSKSFITKSNTNQSQNTENPVDIDANAFEHISKSYQEEQGGTGPAKNLMHFLGLKLNLKE